MGERPAIASGNPILTNALCLGTLLMVNKLPIWILFAFAAFSSGSLALGQRVQFPAIPPGLRPIGGQAPATTTPTMIPINPATQSGIYPSTGYGSPTFDPYSAYQPAIASPAPTGYPPTGYPPSGYPPPGAASPYGNYPAYNGAAPAYPGAGQSGTMGTFTNPGQAYSQPGAYPNSAPSALFPSPNYGAAGDSGGLLGGIFGSPSQGGFGGWNPPGEAWNGQFGQPQFLRFFQGPRIRHAWIHGDDDPNALMINDTDLSLGFAIPNFFYSTQPLYLLPSFSLHQWEGPDSSTSADLPPLAYSAFLDSGWQSDPARIFGAELGLRVGMFTDFQTANSDSLRIMGRGIGRVRLTPRLTLKLGAMYLDRNKVKILPAGGLLWQPNPDTRFDLFFPEPKLAHYLATVGTHDTWWYVGGYYGGGSWTITRADDTTDSIDINDLRLVLGLEWGRNEQMRDGRRVGFVEVGYVFDRELLYKNSPLDNLDLQDTVMIRAGIGY